MTELDIPPEIAELAERRERARGAGDFDAADELRRQIRRAGFDVMDTASGPVVTAAPPEPGPGATETGWASAT